MNGLYKVKFNREMKAWGFMGHRSPYSWDEIVKLIIEKGIEKVQYVQHSDRIPVNTHRLEGKEMLRLWKSVEAYHLKRS
jgi:hypothetical protein